MLFPYYKQYLDGSWIYCQFNIHRLLYILRCTWYIDYDIYFSINWKLQPDLIFGINQVTVRAYYLAQTILDSRSLEQYVPKKAAIPQLRSSQALWGIIYVRTFCNYSIYTSLVEELVYIRRALHVFSDTIHILDSILAPTEYILPALWLTNQIYLKYRIFYFVWLC